MRAQKTTFLTSVLEIAIVGLALISADTNLQRWHLGETVTAELN